MFRWIVGLVLLLVVTAGGLYFLAARSSPPTVVIEKPDRIVGQKAVVEVLAGAPRAKFTSLKVTLEQNGKTVELFSLGNEQQAGALATPDADHVRVSSALGKATIPSLQSGPARIVVEAVRPSILNLKQLTTSATKDIVVRLEPPRLSVVSTHHYVNHGGSELVLYRATPDDVMSGVRVGNVEFPGFSAAGIRMAGPDPSLKAAFFSLLYDQDIATPITLFARDEAGNEATASFVDKVFEKPFKQSRIELDDKFLRRVVPEIIQNSPDWSNPPDASDLLPAFLRINGELRKLNAQKIAEVLAASTATSRFWKGPFVQLGNSQVEAGFADYRTYVYAGKEVDKQVHLGFDLAVTARVPIVAANAGLVLNASWLGIYGNCVIIDHGMGVASLYGHLSSFDVKAGDIVTRGQTIGRSGMTGLAGGDHLHFTMLVNGRAVNPVEWWDAHWVEDRVDRKLREAGAPAAP